MKKISSPSIAVSVINSANTAVHDWEQLYDYCHSNKIGPYIYSILKKRQVSMPGDIAARFREDYSNTACANMILRKEAEWISNALAGEKVRHSFIKGTFALEKIYRDRGIRYTRDIDILVLPEDRDRSVRILEQEGYAVKPLHDMPLAYWMRFMGQVPMARRLRHGEIYIDLHWRILEAGNPFSLDAGQVLETGSKSGLPCISNEDFVIITFATLFCQQSGLYLRNLLDVLPLMHKLRWDTLLRRSRDFRTNEALLAGFGLMKELFGAGTPRQALRELKRHADKGRLKWMENIDRASILRGKPLMSKESRNLMFPDTRLRLYQAYKIMNLLLYRHVLAKGGTHNF